MELELKTSNFKKFKPEMGVPVKISNGMPKYKLSYELTYESRILFPPWALVKDRSISDEAFGELYGEILTDRGLDNVRAQLEHIAELAGDNRLVLMCFEATQKGCHRGDFARWWEAQTGQVVPEVG